MPAQAQVNMNDEIMRLLYNEDNFVLFEKIIM